MKVQLVLAGLLFGGLLGGAVSWGHGNEHRHEAAQVNSHMSQMFALREQVPDDFRIMNRTPVVPDLSSLDKGKVLFARFCVACHGPEGKGDGPAAQAMETKPADFLDLEHSGIYGPGEKYWIVGNGTGETGMPGFGNELLPRDRWDLVNFIYQLQGGAN